MTEIETDISVIVPHVQGQAMLDRCIASVLEAFPVSRTEIILVMNGSKSELPVIPANGYNNITLKEVQLSENLGYTGGCNNGARDAKGTYLLFLSDDVVMPPRSGDLMLTSAGMDTEGGAWQPLILNELGTEIDSAGSLFGPFGFLVHNRALSEVKNGGTGIKRIFAAKGACLLIRRKIFESEDGFEQRFFAYWEETDLQWRLQLQGWKIGVIEGVSVFHIGGATLGVMLSDDELNFLSFRNRIWSLGRNLDRGRLLLVMPMHLVLVAVIGLTSIITGRRSLAKGIFKALLWLPSNVPTILEDRRRIQTRRKVSDGVALEYHVGIGALYKQFRFFLEYLRVYKS